MRRGLLICWLVFLVGVFPVLCAEPLAPVFDPGPDAAPPAAADEDASEMKDIHDIKPPIVIGFEFGQLRYLVWIIAALAVIGVMVYLLVYRKRRQSPRMEIMAEPHETAHLLLDELSDVQLSDGKEFYFRLSAIFRGYLKGRFSLNAPEMTAEELAPAMDKLDFQAELRKNIREFMQYTEPIKFANVYAVEAKMSADLSLVRRFVTETTPKPLSDAPMSED